LLLLSPICPFISEKLWTTLYSSNSIHTQPLPVVENTFEDMCQYSYLITEFNSMVWNKKKETISKNTGRSLSLRDPIRINVPDELRQFKSDLIEMHNLQTSSS
jgi:valyl-tRNA synthetase